MPKKPSYSRQKSVKRSRSRKSVQFTKYNTGLPLIIFGIIYIACYFFAETSPLFTTLQLLGSYIYGLQGMLFIAVCALLYGILSFYRPWLISQWAKQFLLLSVFVSGIVNFGLLSDNTLKYSEYWGYISAPLLEIGKVLFATNIIIIQGIIIIWLIATIVRILMSTNIELPSFPKVDFKVPERPEAKEHQIINNKTSSNKVQINTDTYKNIANAATKTPTEYSKQNYLIDFLEMEEVTHCQKFK